MRFFRLGMAVLAGVLPSSAFAQQDQYAGQWQCQMANYTVTNNRFENYIYNFNLALNPNGQFQAQGNYTAETAGFDQPFVAQGSWTQSPQGISAQGQEQRQGFSGGFSLILIPYSPNSMSYRTQSPYGNLAMACQR